MQVFAFDANPALDRYLYKQPAKRAKEWIIDTMRGRYITLDNGHQAIQLYPPAEVELERVAHNTVLPLGRGSNKMANGLIKHPPRLHYPIPACGDHRLRWMYRFLIMDPKNDERMQHR